MIGRNLTLDITGTMPLDGYRALLSKIENGYEARIRNGESFTNILITDPSVSLVATGNDPHKVYVFDLTVADFATGAYTVALTAIAPNIESVV